MRHDLLSSIAEEKDVTNAIVLTHNIDFVFVQTVVLSALRRCGHPSLTIFADAGSASATFSHQAPLLYGLGARYRVVPMAMEPHFRFHPKALLLSGPAKATLFVGSGNLTFGGWRENAEVWMRFDTQSDGTAPFTAFLAYLRQLLTLVALTEPVRGEIDEAFDAKTHAWAAELQEARGLLGKAGDGLALLDQMLTRVGGVRPERITILAPYFDEDGDAIREIARRTGATDVAVLVQPGRTGLTESAWDGIDAGVRLAPVSFERADEKQRVHEAFIHAKLYAFERAGRVVVFVGSANCSRAALTIPGRAGNAELVAVSEMSREEFQSGFLDEFVAREGSPGLALHPPTSPPSEGVVLRVLGASFEGGYLSVAYAPCDWRIDVCLLDGVAAPFDSVDVGMLGARRERAPRNIVLEGTLRGEHGRSAEAWIDQELELRTTALGRSLETAIRTRVRAGQWGVGAWSEILEVFCAQLKYLPPRLVTGRGTSTGPGSDQPGQVEFTAADVFQVDFSLPSLRTLVSAFPFRGDQRISSLQQGLLRWFGKRIVDSDGDVLEPAQGEGNDGVGTDEVVDDPEKLISDRLVDFAPPANERDARRVQRLVSQVREAMAGEEFLRDRPPELLSADLKLASVLLRVAEQHGWLERKAFFETTHRIWLPLFLDADGDGRGWLQRRYEASTVQGEFAAAMREPGLLAALIAWTIAVPKEARSPEHARFELASALAIARLPWLWDGVNDQEVCQELAAILGSTGGDHEDPIAVGDDAGALWLRLLQRGHALRRLERALVGQSPADLASKVGSTQLAKGELLWQGTAGFCVVMEDAPRLAGTVGVLSLRCKTKPTKTDEAPVKPSQRGGRHVSSVQTQDTSGKTKFMARRTVPLLALLDEAVLPLSSAFDAAPRSVLREFGMELAEGFARD
jgi:hypothetical protein